MELKNLVVTSTDGTLHTHSLRNVDFLTVKRAADFNYDEAVSLEEDMTHIKRYDTDPADGDSIITVYVSAECAFYYYKSSEVENITFGF